MRHIGIDLGTSNCLIAEVVENASGEPEVQCLKSTAGKYKFPSVLSYIQRDKCYFGEKAEELLLSDPESTVSLSKTRLGTESSFAVKIGNEQYQISSPEISATLLKQLTFRYGDKINRAVITKPANYGMSQNQAVQDFIDIAEFNMVDTIEEPSAAIMYHLYKSYRDKTLNPEDYKIARNILVVDFGGGTLDLSLVEVQNQNGGLSTRVVCNAGDCGLGGEMIDLLFEKAVLRILANQSNSSVYSNISDDFEQFYDNFVQGKRIGFSKKTTSEEKSFVFHLKKILEQVKIQLSTQESAVISIDGFKDIKITREVFEKNILEQVGEEIEFVDKLKNVLKKIADFAFRNQLSIYQTVLIGGTSNIPYVQRTVINELRDLFDDFEKTKIVMSDDYGDAVVKGAAILCAIKDGVRIKPFNAEVCQTIVSKNIQIKYGELQEIIVNQGEPYPFETDKEIRLNIFHSLAPYQKIEFNEVFERPNGLISSKKVLDFNFYLPIYYTNDLILLSFNINKNGLYKIKLVHEFTGDEIDYENKIVGALSSEDKNNSVKILSRLG